jgi:hypothetical protein
VSRAHGLNILTGTYASPMLGPPAATNTINNGTIVANVNPFYDDWRIAPGGLAVAFPPLPQTALGTYPNRQPSRRASHRCDRRGRLL